MHKRTLIQNATIVNEGEAFLGSLLIVNHHIEEVLRGQDAESVCPPDEVINAQGCYLLPGVIDTHVHFRDPGLTHKADMKSEKIVERSSSHAVPTDASAAAAAFSATATRPLTWT